MLQEWNACEDGLVWWMTHCEGLSNIEQVKRLIKDDCPDPDWANWLIVRIMKPKQYLTYAIYAAEQVIDIYEKEFPCDNRPRKAIEAAKKVLQRNTEKNRDAASAAASDAAYAVYAAVYAAARSASDAAASAAARSDVRAASAAAYAVYAAKEKRKMQRKILNYGIELLQEQPQSVV